MDITDNFSHAGGAMTPREREGIGCWIPSVVAGKDQLAVRLVHWTDDSVGGPGRSTSEALIRIDTMITISYKKTGI